MEKFSLQPDQGAERARMKVAFRAPEDLVKGSPVMYGDTMYTIREIYPDMKNGVEIPMYLLEDAQGEPLQKDGIMVYVPFEELGGI